MTTKKIVSDIIKALEEGPYQDLSDVGNLIGIALGKAKVQEKAEDGNDLIGFYFGIHHGLDVSENIKERLK